MPDPAHWLNKLRHLNPNRSRTKGMAPHKPCLLLSLLDMAQDGELIAPDLRRTPGLHARFNAFTSIALPRWGGKVDVRYPFYHLKSQGDSQTKFDAPQYQTVSAHFLRFIQTK